MALSGRSKSATFKESIVCIFVSLFIISAWGSGCQSYNEYSGPEWVAPTGLGDGKWYKMHRSTYTFVLEREDWFDRRVKHVFLEIAKPGDDIQVVRPDVSGDAKIEVHYYTGDKVFDEEFKTLTELEWGSVDPAYRDAGTKFVRWGPKYFDYEISGDQIRGAMVGRIVVTIPKRGPFSDLRFSIRSSESGDFFEYKDRYQYEDLKEMFRSPTFGDNEKIDALSKLDPSVGLTWFQFVELISKLNRDEARAKLLGYDYESLEYAYPNLDITSRIPNCPECIHGVGAAFATKSLAIDLFEAYKARYEKRTGKRLPPMPLEISGMVGAFFKAYTVPDVVRNGELRLRLVDLYLKSTAGTPHEQMNIIVMFSNFFFIDSPIDRISTFEILEKVQPRLTGYRGESAYLVDLVVQALFPNSSSDQEKAKRIILGEV